MLALTLAAESAGKTASMLLPDPVPLRYQFLFDRRKPAGKERFAALADGADVIVILDTSVLQQLDGLEEQIAARRDKLVVIDHHATTGQIADVQWIDPSAAAVGAMVMELIGTLGWPVGAETAEALLVAITADTGWFQFANTDGRCLRAVAELLDGGLRVDRLYRRLFQSDRPERLRLAARMLASLELHCDGRLAVMTITREDFAQSGARPEETENLVNEALWIGGVEVAVLLVEQERFVRASLRSRDAVDVAEIASRLGGGGHPRAAGAKSTDSLDSMKKSVIDLILSALKGQGPAGRPR
jgi:phosphoesterase RecJ-like protein